jgi:hypothetical protein
LPSPTVLRRLALAGAATGVAALTGCSAVTTSGYAPESTQASPLAAVDLSQQFCAATDGTPEAGEACAPFVGYASGNTFVPFTTPGSGRLLVLAEVADGAPDPVFHLRRSPSTPLVREDAVIPSPSTAPKGGYHWVGYRSAIVTYALGERNPGDLLEASIPVQPLATKSSVLTVGVGVQVIQDGRGKDYGDRPVACAENLQGSSDISSTTCPGSGDRAGLNTTDAQVSAPQGTAAADAGTTARLDFAVAQAGTVAEASALRVDASTTVDGGSATSGVAEIPWAITPELPVDPDPGDDGTIEYRAAQRSGTTRRATVVGEDGTARTPVTVAVTVPDTTPTGDYAVTLRIRDTAGVERTASASLRVTGKPVAPAPAAPAASATPAPTAVLSTLRTTKVNATRRRLHAGRVTCKSSTRCIVSTVVRAGTKRVGFVRFVLQPGKSGAVSLRLSRPATALLAKRGGTVTVSVDAGGPKTLVRVTKLAVQRG